MSVCVCERERAMLCVCLSVCRQYLFPISVDITHTHTRIHPVRILTFRLTCPAVEYEREREGGREGRRVSQCEEMSWGEVSV